MKSRAQPWRAGTWEPESAGIREAWDRWYQFLADECQKDDGLLCFYDREKSPQVIYFCGLLAQCLTGSDEETDSGEPVTIPAVRGASGSGEKAFRSLEKSLPRVIL